MPMHVFGAEGEPARASDSPVTRISLPRYWLADRLGVEILPPLLVAALEHPIPAYRLPRGVLALVDRSCTVVRDDGLYVVSWPMAGAWWLRQARRLPDGKLTFVTDSMAPRASRGAVPARSLDDAIVIGAVVCGLNLRSLTAI